MTKVELESTGAKLKCTHYGEDIEGMTLRTHQGMHCLVLNTKEQLEEKKERERKRRKRNNEKTKQNRKDNL